jgi:hypothetical protein
VSYQKLKLWYLERALRSKSLIWARKKNYFKQCFFMIKSLRLYPVSPLWAFITVAYFLSLVWNCVHTALPSCQYRGQCASYFALDVSWHTCSCWSRCPIWSASPIFVAVSLMCEVGAGWNQQICLCYHIPA